MRALFRMVALCVVALIAVVSPAAAQTADFGKWEIEFHGGGLLPTNPTAGTVSLPGQAHRSGRRIGGQQTPAVKLNLPLAEICRLRRRGRNNGDKCHHAESDHPE